MNLVKDLKDLKSTHLVITGDGSSEFNIVEEICKIYNGPNKVLWFPRTPLLRRTGLGALDAVKRDFIRGFTTIVYIVDREYIRESAINEVKEYLHSIGINIHEISEIQEAFSMKCKSGSNEFILYCIISGVRTCIEEEIVKLIDLVYGIKINLPENRDSNWIKIIKREIRQKLKDKNKSIQDLIKDAGKRNLEKTFSNLCVVLRKVEEGFQS